MWEEEQMAKFKEYDVQEIDALRNLGKALSSPIRIEILQLLYEKGMIIGYIAKELDLPASSTAFHLDILEQAGLVRMERQPGNRGTAKFCNRKVDFITVNLIKKNTDIDEISSTEMPIGAFFDCKVTPTCGLYGPNGYIGYEDSEKSFYCPDRINAGIIWSSSGYLEYKFPNGIPQKRIAKKLSLSMEICSEAAGYNEDWKSDITIWINGKDIGTWTCPSDFGSRRGRLNPPSWPNGSTQYGLPMIWEVRKEGTYLNGEYLGDITIEQLEIMKQSYITVRVGNKSGAQYEGGFNIFGKHYGDYNQDIVLTVEY